MHKLDGPRLKIRRAKSEIERLRRREEIFRKNTKYSAIRKELNPKSGNYVMRVHVNGPPPFMEDWGVYIGEIAHNLRSALDGLVYQLAKRSTNTPTWDTQFPICLFRHITTKRRERNGKLIHPFEGRRRGDGRHSIRSLCRKHQALIERLQPYKRSNSSPFISLDRTKYRGRNSPLFWLKEINNADKLRLIQVVVAKTGGFNVTGWGNSVEQVIHRTNPFITLKEGAKVCEIPPDVQVNINLTPYMAFAHGCEAVRKRLVIITLNIIAEHVSEIVESFASEF